MARRGPSYINELIISYDIETTSYKRGALKRAFAYTHTVSVNGTITIHRKVTDFIAHLNRLCCRYEATTDKRIVIYVHNLAYEFSFIKHYFEWVDDEVHAIGSTHRIVRALTTDGIEFRCSYMLTNSALAHVGKEVGIAKAEGDLDYDLIRHTETELTPEEIGYIEADVKIIDALIKERLAESGGYKSIPWTATGYVRRDVRAAVFGSKEYKRLVKSLNMTEDDYTAARAAFQGGYVHANATVTGVTCYGVTAVDLASSYPASMIRGNFPMAPFVEIPDATWDDAIELLDGTCQILDVTLTGVTSRYPFPPISQSRAITSAGLTVDNGRIYSADTVRVLCTDVDMAVYLRAYDIDHIQVNSLRISTADRLPEELGLEVLRYYGMKTELKGVEGQEENYRLGKAYTNSIYGMVATDPVRDEFIFSNDTKDMTQVYPNTDNIIKDHNTGRSRFLFYPWAAWVTAYSRQELLMTIYDMIDAGITALYCDTDSIYFITDPKAFEIIESRNINIHEDVTSYLAGAPEELFSPKTIKGEEKPLGAWEEEPVSYREFKTLGAKRYATTDERGHFTLTVSGLAKRAAAYVEEQGGMEYFKDGMTIPEEHTGRMTHDYSDGVIDEEVTDYNGVTTRVQQHGWVHLENTDYHLTIGTDYLNFMYSITE